MHSDDVPITRRPRMIGLFGEYLSCNQLLAG